MRLLAIIHGPVYGGAHAQLIRLREPLARRGFETIVLVPEGGTGEERLRLAGMEVVTAPLHRLRATPDPRVQFPFLASFPRELRRVRRLLRELEIDVVQVHGPTNPLGAVAAHREGIAVVWQIYDTVAPMWLRRLTMPMVVRLADAITTWGLELGRAHPGTLGLGERHVVVYPPVDTDVFAPARERRASAREELGIPDGATVVGTVGNLNPSKGHEYLIRAAELVRRSRDDVCFRIMGAHSPPHAEYEEGLHREARERGLDGAIEILDPGTRVAELLPALDVFAVTSVPHSEGIPTVILEAMASGIPPVVTRVGAIDELVDDGVNGILLPPEQPETTARAILELLEDPALRERLGAAGRATAVERYGLEGLADRHAHAYELALAHRRGRGGR